MKKPIIVWLDVDDVLLDFKGMYNIHLRDNYDVKIPKNYVPKNWSYTEVLPKKVEFSETMRTLGKFWSSNQKSLPGASQFTKKLKKLGVRIILITHIEGDQGPNRLKCLTDEGIHFDEAYFTMGRTKSDFAKEAVKRYPGALNLFMDDKAENVVDFMENVPNVRLGLTLDLPFNSPTLAKAKAQSPGGGALVWVKDYTDMYKVMLNFIKDLKKGKTK